MSQHVPDTLHMYTKLYIDGSMTCLISLLHEKLLRITSVAIAARVPLHSKAAEGLAKKDRGGYDIHFGIVDAKALFSKYCKSFEKRIRSMLPTYPVVPEDSTRFDKCLHAGTPG
jgi:hypothetical protein